MKSCRKWRDLLVLDYYGEMTPGQRRRLDRHLEKCAACRQTALRLKKQLESLPPPDRREPEDSFWKAFSSRLDRRLDHLEATGAIQPLYPRARPAWALAAAALVLLILGGVAGRLLFPPGASTPNPAEPVAQGTRYATNLRGHLDALHPVLVDCAATPAPRSPSDPLPSHAVIEDLLLRNRLLKRQAELQHDAAARELLEEIEVILLELNAAVPGDTARMNQVHQLTNRQDLILRLDILRRDPPGGSRPEVRI